MRSYLKLAIISAIAASMVLVSNNSAIALTNDERYNSGYNHGCSDAGQGGHPYLSGSGGAGAHTVIFMNGYNDGYNTCSPSPSSPAPVSTSNQDFSNVCTTIQNYLVSGCGEYVNPNGSLTTEGQRAHDCIVGGGLLSGAGILSGLPPIAIIAALEPLSNLPFYECEGIVQWDTLRNDVRAATFFLGILGL